MFTRSRSTLILFLSAALTIFSRAESPAVKGMDSGQAPLHFVTPASVDFVKLIPAPARLESAEYKAEMDTILRVQEQRTEADIARAKSEHKLKIGAFQSVLGDWVTPEKLPLTAKLIKNAEGDSKFFSGAAKDFFGRPRPKHDPRVKPTLDGEDEPSYPSGHATRGLLFASILSELDPDHRDALMERGREIGWDRIVAGLHHPSDIVAGRMLGQALFQAMMSNPEFQKDLAAAKEEYAAAKAMAK